MRLRAAFFSALALLVVAASPAIPQQQITTHPSYDADPAWSPDGSLIAFTSSRSGSGFHIWVIPATGGTATQITTHPTIDRAPAWSPAGSPIAFTSFRSGNLDIWVIPGTGTIAVEATTWGRIKAAFKGAPGEGGESGGQGR